MTQYIAIEKGYNKDYSVEYELHKDGQLVITDNLIVVHKWIKENLIPGDTYQEQYRTRSTRVWSFGDMVLEWELEDAFDNEDEQYKELSVANDARYHALRMVGK